MKKNLINLLAMAVAIIGFAGCATNNKVSSYGFTKPEQAVSIPHPVENEKAGEQYVTVFTAILDGGVWGVESIEGAGVWPILAEQKGAKLLVGYSFATDLNWWGDYLLQAVTVGRKKELVESKIISLNRDGGWVYNLTDQNQESDYDPERFDNDPVYRTEVFQNGTTLSELEIFWKTYFEKRGVDLPQVVFSEEILIGSARWEEFKSQLAEKLGHNYKMPGGEVRQGYLPLDCGEKCESGCSIYTDPDQFSDCKIHCMNNCKDFRREASQNNGATAGQRFARNAFVPVAFDPITLGIGATSSILNGLVAVSNGPLEGFYAQAECLRGDLKPNFRLMQKMFKVLLQERDQEIYKLQQELEALGAPGRTP